MTTRLRVIDALRFVFESFGFAPLQTPTLEYAELLMGKYGEEADKLLYTFEDRGGRRVGLNYDLTVPTARVLAQYPNLPKPFKRYQIQPAYRAENTQKGRYRQFTQCDIDIFGSTSPVSDAEILTVIFSSLKVLKFNDFKINLNSRPILYQIMTAIGLPEAKWATVLQTIDKLDKTPDTTLLDAELLSKGFTDKLFTVQIAPRITETLTTWNETKKTGDSYLDQVIEIAKEMGVSANYLRFSPSLVRGLDYYTGPTFETIIDEPKIGSVTGGGRYDNLIKTLGGPEIPAVGTTIGLDRICDVIEELKLWTYTPLSATKYLVTVFAPSLLSASIAVASRLRARGISTELFPDNNSKLEKQIKYADKKKIPYCIIIGDTEAGADQFVLKNMETGQQQTLPLTEIETLPEWYHRFTPSAPAVLPFYSLTH